jgi:hypothetical protein
MTFGWPYRFIAFLKNASAALQSRCFVTKDFSGEHWPETVPPIAHNLMADIDPAFMEQVFNIAK